MVVRFAVFFSFASQVLTDELRAAACLSAFATSPECSTAREAISLQSDDAVHLVQLRASSKNDADRGMPDPSRCDADAVASNPPSGTPQPSPGCALPVRAKCAAGGPQKLKINVKEPSLGGETLREYVALVPDGVCDADAIAPSPMMLFFHGQYGESVDESTSFKGWAKASGYSSCATANGYISVFPQGLDDSVSETTNIRDIPSNNGNADLGTGWNVGAAGDENTCAKKVEAEKGAFAGMEVTEYSCYESCLKLGKCGQCNWSTCHDDVAFIRTLLTHFSENYCIDLSRLYAAGESNGGMMTHHISQELPNTFAAFSPVFGLPLVGYAVGKSGQLLRNTKALMESAIIEFHDRQDTIIPVNGGPATAPKWVWYYESLDQMMAIWSSIHNCEPEAVGITAELEKAFKLHIGFQCFEYKGCASSRRVVKCLYDGWHGKPPNYFAAGNTAVWFFNQFRRHTPVSW